uniref:VWFD domain-containing protein n=1 Tax=Poecilia latipinna TaxID=48699 RepID=A0A3B3UBK6_9TELE
MTCSSNSCGPYESCMVEDGVRGCIPNSFATCWIRGPGSYHTFDGVMYQYPGACRLTLAKVMGSSDHSHFMITVEKVPQGPQGFSNVLKFEAEGTQVAIEMASSSTVKVSDRNHFLQIKYITYNEVVSAHSVPSPKCLLKSVSTKWDPATKLEASWLLWYVCQSFAIILQCKCCQIFKFENKCFLCLEIPCPANSHYEAQGTGCPSTCVNPNSTYNCPLPDQESCVCNSGYLLSGGVCVPHADCGCSFEGHYYRSGETVILDADCGRRCTCSYVRGCTPNSFATCWIRGPGSYHTFDGVMYQYPGACRLTLAKVMGSSDHSHFMITVEKVDGQLIRLPFSSGSNRIRIFQSSTHSVILRTTFGVTLQTVWPHFVRVTAPGVYSGLLGGLCGNYNADQHDDFRTPNGTLVSDSQVFGDSWRDGSLADHCVENRPRSSATNFSSTEYCGVLTSPTGPLTSCWAAVNPWQQVDACVEILQGSSDPASTLCEVLRDYALMCQHNGVSLGQWRNATGCGKF